jgi:hypothetical protein
MDKLRLRPEHYVGAASEHFAAHYFMGRGYQVYWPAVAQSAVDFLIEDGAGIFKVQAKTATMNRAGGREYLQCRTRLTNGGQDLKPKELYAYLVVVYQGELWVIPSEVIESSNLSLRAAKWDAYKAL